MYKVFIWFFLICRFANCDAGKWDLIGDWTGFYWSCDLRDPNIFMRDLEQNISRSIFGQHLIPKFVLEPLRQHINNPNPSKPLVMSFQGPPGVGKNFLAYKIAHHMFKRGVHSPYVVVKIGNHDFINPNRIHEYSDELKYLIKKTVKWCDRSLFIFDEVDKMPDSLFNVLRPFMDHNNHIDFVDYRKCIFIIISNIGSKAISDIVYGHTKQGYKRETLGIKDFISALQYDNFNSKGALRMSSLVSNHLIDFFIPFLPLEREHVIRCIIAESRLRNIPIDENTVSNILDTMTFVPQDDGIFSSSGCKNIYSSLSAFRQYGRDEL